MTFQISSCPQCSIHTGNDERIKATMRQSLLAARRIEDRRYSAIEGMMSSKKAGDTSINVTSLYMKIVGFWVATNYAEKRRRNVAMFYTFFIVFVALTIEARDLYFTWGDFGDTIYTACNVVTIVLVVVKMLILLVNNDKLLELIHYAETNFWHSNYDPFEQKIMDNCKRTCTFLVCTFTFFAQGTVAGFVLRPILVNHGKNASEWILPFNMWFDESLYVSPYFEIIFFIQVLCTYQVGMCYHCFDNFLCLINLHTAGQFRILQYRFANMNESLGRSLYSIEKYETFRTYVREHQALIEYCKRLENVFSVIALGQVSLFSLLICLDGYLVLMEGISRPRRIIFTFHIMGCMCQLLMFTYSCDCLIHDSMNVATSASNSSWSVLPMDKYGKMLRNDLILVIMRSQTPCCLTASGFFAVSLETYTGILSTSVSYFTLLKNHAEDTDKT